MNTLSISSYRGPSVHIPALKLSTVYLAIRVATLQEKTKKKSPKKKENEASYTYLALVRLILNIFGRNGRMVNPLQQLCCFLCTKHR